MDKERGIILSYNLTKPHLQSMDLISRKKGLYLKEVKKEDQIKTIGEILNLIPGDNNSTKEFKPFEDELLIFCFLNDEEFNYILSNMKSEKINIPLKAMLTEHNISWNSLYLYEHLNEEIRSIQKQLANRK